MDGNGTEWNICACGYLVSFLSHSLSYITVLYVSACVHKILMATPPTTTKSREKEKSKQIKKRKQ